jgi:hypothetical protein
MKLKWIAIRLCASLVFVSLNATAGPANAPLLISGFDDVLRQAENQSLWRAGLKLFSEDETFAGMPELYAELTRAYGGEGFSLVSATSSIFRSRIGKFLAESGFPPSDLYLRNWTTQWSVENFKVGSIRTILGSDSTRRFTVIFDNSPPSLEMAKSIPDTFPGSVQAIYLHEIVERPLPAGATYYLTAFDIALAELKAGRLPESSARRIGQAIIGESRPERIIPKYAYCPGDYDPCTASSLETLREVCAKVREKIAGICRVR